jgi:hypothetical protein
MALKKVRDRVCGAYRIEYRGDDNSERAKYGLVEVAAPGKGAQPGNGTGADVAGGGTPAEHDDGDDEVEWSR